MCHDGEKNVWRNEMEISIFSTEDVYKPFKPDKCKRKNGYAIIFAIVAR